MEQLIAERVASERRALKHEMSDTVERRLILAIEKNVDPWIANVKKLQQAETAAAGPGVRQQLKDMESVLAGMGRGNDKRDDALRLHQRTAAQEAAALRAAATEAMAKASSVQKETKAMLVDLKAQVSQLNKEGKRTFRELQDRLDALEATGKTTHVTAETVDQDATALSDTAQALTDRIDALHARMSALTPMQGDGVSLVAHSDYSLEAAKPPGVTTLGLMEPSPVGRQAQLATELHREIGLPDELSTQAQLDVIEDQSKLEDQTPEQPEEEPPELETKEVAGQVEAATSSRLAKKQRRRQRQAVAKVERREAETAATSDDTGTSAGDAVSGSAADATASEEEGTSTCLSDPADRVRAVASDPMAREDVTRALPIDNATTVEDEKRAAASRSNSCTPPAALPEVAGGTSRPAAQPVSATTPTLGYYASSAAVCLPFESVGEEEGNEDNRLDATMSPGALDTAASAPSSKLPAGRSKAKGKAKAKKAMAMASAARVDNEVAIEAEGRMSHVAVPDEAAARQITTTANADVQVKEKDEDGSESQSSKVADNLQQQQPGDGALVDIAGPGIPRVDGTAALQNTSVEEATLPIVTKDLPEDPLVAEAAAVVATTEQLELQPLPTIPKGLTGKKASAARKALGKARAGTCSLRLCTCYVTR